MQFKESHKRIILDHYRNPRHKKEIAESEQDSVLDNPSCGDRVALQIHEENGIIMELNFDGEGCSLSMASASMLTDLITGKPLEEARTTCTRILKVFRGEAPASGLNDFGDIAAFEELTRYPVRLKCATLAWETLEQFWKTS